MANLRANNLTGTGGRNALDGSVFFDGSSKLSIPNTADVRVGSNDFTIEAWIKVGNPVGDWDTILGMWDSSNTRRTYTLQRKNSDGELYLYVSTDGGGTNWANANGGNVTVGDWHHVAGVRDGNTLRVYLNGVEVDNTSYSGTIYNNTTDALFIGDVESTDTNNFDGYISNVRFVNGTCLYPSGTTFTPPTEKLTAVANTQVLACQDSDDPTQEATGKTITGYGSLDYSDRVNLVTGSWTDDSSGSGSGSGSGKSITVTGSGLSNRGVAYQTCTVVVGKKYVFSYRASAAGANCKIGIDSNDGTSNVIGNVGNNPDLLYNTMFNGDATVTSGKYYRGLFTATTTSAVVYFQEAGTGTFSADDISLKLAPIAKASKVLPQVGVDEGVTFDGDTKINSLNYMYFPAGDTPQRGRGRAIFAGGYRTPDKDVNTISYVQIQSSGNTTDFGDLTQERASFSGSGNETRGWFASGYDYDSPNANYDIIDYITIATTANALDFGNLAGAKRYVACLSNSTRGVSGGGYYPAYLNVVEYITIASTGDATNFGDITTATTDMAGLNSPTRGIFAGGASPSASLNTIEYITIASTGDATNFGDLTQARRASGSANSSTRGVFTGGHDPSNKYNTIDYITIASTGDATDFGDLSATRGYVSKGQACTVTRGLVGGGSEPGAVNTIQYITIASTGNAVDFGDISGAGCWEAAAACDSHGGLE